MSTRGPQSAPFPGAARTILKAAVRSFGLATSPVRPLPDFLIIGAKRGGTTSLYFDLIQHPSVIRLYPPPVPGLKSVATKGVHFFDSAYFHGEHWYRSYMPTTVTRRLVTWHHGAPASVGEASPFYLFHPAAAERAHAMVPHARIILLLRDPVMRTYSHWKQQRKTGMEPFDFAAALDAEPARLEGERERLLADPRYLSHAWEQQSYATQSRYADALRPWLDLFGRDRFFVAPSEEYYADPDRVLGDIYDFLGLPRRNTATGGMRNAAAGSDLPAELADRLRAAFAAPNRDLEGLLGRTFPWA